MVCPVRYVVGGRKEGKGGTEKLIVDSGAIFPMTRNADLPRDLHPIDDKVKIGNGTPIGTDR